MSEENKVMKQGTKHRTKHSYGWTPDLPDHRDKIYSAVYKTPTESPLPQIVDLRPTDSPIFDQGQLGSCTGNALAGALQFLEKKDKVHYIGLSRLFIYYDERAAENTVASDSGASIRDGIKTLASLGVCSETCWPYDISKFAVQPSHSCYVEAAKHRILTYSRLNTVVDMRHCLSSGYPFVFGFSVYESFESEEVAKTGIVPMPQPDEQLLGGHAVMGLGCDMTKKIFPESIGAGLCRNSWGTDWGMQGYFWIPLEYLADRNISEDFWTIRREQGF